MWLVVEKTTEIGTKRVAQPKILIPAEVEASALAKRARLDAIGQKFSISWDILAMVISTDQRAFLTKSPTSGLWNGWWKVLW